MMLVRMGCQLAGPVHRPQQRTAARNMMHGINRVANRGGIIQIGGNRIHGINRVATIPRASRQVVSAVLFNMRRKSYADCRLQP